MPYPIIPPPAGDAGALTNPRHSQRWLDVNRITKLDRCQTFVSIPTFAQVNEWNGYSDIVASFNVEAPNNISLKAFVAPTSPNFVLCVSYRIGIVVTRYLMWDATGSNLNQTITPYTGQMLLKNFRFEIWNTSQGATSSESVITFNTTKLQTVDYRYGVDAALVSADAENDSFDNTNETITLPTTFLQYHFKSTSGFVVDGSNNVTSWTDSINAVVLAPTGSVIGQVITPVTALSAVSALGGYLSGAGLGANPGTVAVSFCLYNLTATGNIFDNGYGINVSFDSAAGKLNTYLDGVSTTVLEAAIWYVVIMTPSTGKTMLYNMQTGVLLETFYASSTTGPDVTLKLGATDVAVVEAVIYNDELTSSEIEQLRGYFVQTYFSTLDFTIPLTFPTTSVSTTN